MPVIFYHNFNYERCAMRLQLGCLCFLFAGVFSPSYSMQQLLKMPKESILNDRLQEQGFDHFMEKTGIVQRIAGRDLYPGGVVMAVELALADYDENLKKGMPAAMARQMSVIMQMRKSQLLDAILGDIPGASQAVNEFYKEMQAQ